MLESVDIDRRAYAIVMSEVQGDLWAKQYHHHLIGEMKNTPYGDLVVYYTGDDPRYLSLAPKLYQFSSDSQIAEPD